VVLAEGVVVEEGPPREVLRHPQHPETRRLLQTE
jgi:ABC-type dipeptide/oligopeptide/nickel transport system ATPase component